MASIYDLHDKAFNQVSAFAIMKGKKHIFNVSIKYPRDGAGRLWVYFHYIGLEMVRGYAGGYGYDKRSAAVQDAIAKIPLPVLPQGFESQEWAQKQTAKQLKDIKRLKKLFKDIGGDDWHNVFRNNGYTIINVI